LDRKLSGLIDRKNDLGCATLIYDWLSEQFQPEELLGKRLFIGRMLQ